MPQGELSTRAYNLAVNMALGMTTKTAAKEVGLSERQAYRVCSTPAFRREIQHVRTRLLDSALGQLTAAAVLASEKILHLIHHRDPTIALRACRAAIDMTSRNLTFLQSATADPDMFESGIISTALNNAPLLTESTSAVNGR